MPLTLIYGTMDVCTFVMCLVKTRTFHLRHILKVDFDFCFLTFLFVVLSLLYLQLAEAKDANGLL